MKNKIFLPIIFASIMFLCGCKECDDCPAPETTISKTEWMLTYFEGSSGNYMYYAPPSFVSGGRIKMASNLFHQGYWFSKYDLPVPPEINLNLDTDTIKLTAYLRNVSGDGTANEIDLGMYWDVAGNKYSSATWQKLGSGTTYCLLGVGSQTMNNISEHLTDVTTYAEYSIVMVGNQITSYKNGTALKSLTYTGTTGYLKQIDIGFRGYGECDWIKLYKGSKLIMDEEFNTDGKTTATWTLP